VAIAANKRLIVDRYSDEAVGVLAKNDSGKLAITQVTLRPKVTFGGPSTISSEDLSKLHELAHDQCFIANSVRTAVTVEPR
jgi:organic hydroperoxide reductase OsmC/OhrA